MVIVHITRLFVFYISCPTTFAGISLSFLYMTVLGFNGITNGFLYSQGLEVWQVIFVCQCHDKQISQFYLSTKCPLVSGILGREVKLIVCSPNTFGTGVSFSAHALCAVYELHLMGVEQVEVVFIKYTHGCHGYHGLMCGMELTDCLVNQ